MSTVLLGELTELVKTWNPIRSPEANFCYVDLSAVDNESKTIVTSTTVTGAAAPSRARQLVTAGDVLVSTVRPNLNAVAVVPADLDGATASTGFTVLRPGSQLDGRYLFHWIQSQAFVSDMVRKATGASYPAVSDRIVKESAIPLPSLAEQRRIAAILDHADALSAKRRQVLAHLDALSTSIFHNMFDGRSDPIQRLDSLVDSDDRMNYGVVQPGDEVADGVPLIRVSNIVGDVVDRRHLKRIAPEIEAAYNRSRIRGTEILVSCVGSIGAVSLVSAADIGSNLARAVTRVPISNPTTRAYVAAFLRTAGSQRYFQAELRTVAQPTLNVKQLAATPVPVPSSDLQSQLLMRLQSLNCNRAAVRLAQQLDDELFASLQARAFKGEL